jgi:hypothetical protein
MSLSSYFDTDPVAGLELARNLQKYFDIGITGMFSKADAMRITAHLMISIGGQENLLDAKILLEEAIKVGSRTGFVVSTMR